MGSQRGGLDSGNFVINHRGNLGSPYPHRKLVQQQALEGMEARISAVFNMCDSGGSSYERSSMGEMLDPWWRFLCVTSDDDAGQRADKRIDEEDKLELNGLNLCKNLNFLSVEIDIDAKAIVDLLSNSLDANKNAFPLVDDCMQMISQLSQVRIRHCYREANACADCLGRIGAKQARNFILYDDPPVDIVELISSDKSGVYHNRLCPEYVVPSYFFF